MKESFQRIIAWMRAHPLLSAVIIGGVILLGYLAYRRAQSGGNAGASMQVGQPETGAAGGAAPEAPPLTPVPPVPGMEATPISFPSFEGYTVSGGGGGGYKTPPSSFVPAVIPPVAPIEVAAPAAGASLLQSLSSDFYAGIGYTPEQTARMQSTPPGEKPPMNVFGGNLLISDDMKVVTSVGPPSPGISAEAQAALNEEFKNPFAGDVQYPNFGNVGTPAPTANNVPAPNAPIVTPAPTSPIVAQPGSLADVLGIAPSQVFQGNVSVNVPASVSSGGGAKVAMPVQQVKSTSSSSNKSTSNKNTSSGASLQSTIKSTQSNKSTPASSSSNPFAGSVSVSSNLKSVTTTAPKTTTAKPASNVKVGTASQSKKVDKMK